MGYINYFYVIKRNSLLISYNNLLEKKAYFKVDLVFK